MHRMVFGSRVSVDSSHASSSAAQRRRRSLSSWSWTGQQPSLSLASGAAAEVLQSVDTIQNSLDAELHAVEQRGVGCKVPSLQQAVTQAENAHPDNLWMRLKFAWKGMRRIARIDASVVLVPLVLLGLMLGLGVWAVLAASHDQEVRYKGDAAAAARSLSESILSGVRDSYMPAVMLGNFISLYPDWQELLPKLPDLAAKLLSTNGAQHTQTLEVAPFGVYAGSFPPSAADTSPPGIDLLPLDQPALRTGVLGLIAAQTPYVQLTGPYLDRSGNNIFLPTGLHSITMVFVPNVTANATFNIPLAGPTKCPFCYDPFRRRKFWGAVGCTVDWRGLRDAAHWERFADMGYHYRLTRFSTFINETILLAGSAESRPGALLFDVPVARDINWQLEVARRGGWVPTWRDPLLGVVVGVAVLVPLLVFLVIVKQRQHTLLLLSIVPQQAVRYLASGRKYARSFDNVTVLFSDIVRYTELSSGLTAIQVVELLDEVYAAFDVLCEAHGIYRCDVIGDAYMAVAGIPDPEEPHAAAVRAARMAQAMVEVTRRMVTKSGIQIQIRVGLHSGPLVAAVLGSHSSPKYTVLGDTVNTASRMESSSEPMAVQLSDATAQLLLESGVRVEMRPRGEVNIKGKGARVRRRAPAELGMMATHWLDCEVGNPVPANGAVASTTTASGLAKIAPSSGPGSSSGSSGNTGCVAVTVGETNRGGGSSSGGQMRPQLPVSSMPTHPFLSVPFDTVVEVDSAGTNAVSTAAAAGGGGGGGGGRAQGQGQELPDQQQLGYVGELSQSLAVRRLAAEEWA